MIIHDINREYYEWLCDLIKDSKPSRRVTYNKLVSYLYNTEFSYVIPMDGNRYEDGIELRYRFGYDHSIDAPIIASYLDVNPCNVLEMMVALAFRCEEHIMFNPENGILSGRWFWKMISNLGLDRMDDNNYDEEYVNNVVWRFLNRDYDRDGRGGLITLPDCPYDLRSMDIWSQMMHYLSECKE